MLGNISTVTTTDLITAAKFNEIQNQVYQIVGPTFYDYKGYVSHAVTTSTVVAYSNWGNLHQDINQCIIHQTNQAITTEYPQTGQLITATFVNSLINYANQAYANSSTIALGQISNSTFNSTSTRVTTWNATLDHHVQYSWITSTDAEGFFALGGYFRVHLDSAGGTSTADDIIWRNLIVAAEANLVTAPYQFGYADWSSLASGASKTVTAASYLTESVQIVYTKTNYETVDIHVRFVTNGLRTIDLNVFSTVYEYYSVGGVGPIPHGFPARRPDVITVLGLDGNQGFNAFTPRQAISLSPTSMSFSGYTSSTLASQVLSISNVGNTVTSVTSIGGTGANTLQVQVSPNSFPITINSGTTATVSISYIGQRGGTFNDNITVAGPFDAGNSTLPTTISLVYQPFDFTLTPSSISTTITVSRVYTQQIAINPINGIYSNYTAAFSVQGSGFSFQTPQPLSGPVLVYDPTGLAQGTYSATINVTVNGVTHSATVTYVNQIPQSSHLGDWVSALGNNNAVVGMSYDIITGNRYLTIGLGVGANGSTTLDAGGSSYVNVSYLNYQGDSLYKTGEDPTLQNFLVKTPYISAWGAFLNLYGVWVDSNNTQPNDVWLSRTFHFTVPGGTYEYQFSCDNEGYFDIDGSAAIAQQNSNYGGSVAGPIGLSAGQHTVTLHFKNDGAVSSGNPGGIALNIFNPNTGQSYWSTLKIVSNSAYLYWQEVYRIPIPANGTPVTLYNAPYAVKDVGAVLGNRWSSYFGNASDASAGSIFAVTDDGAGNLTINMLATNQNTGNSYYDTSLINYAYIIYYYADSNIGAGRYTQLEGIQNGTQTHQFTGFTNAGAVTTSLTTYPGYSAATGGGGGGGGSDWLPVIVAVALLPIGKIICKKLYQLDKLPEDIYQADQAYGAELSKSEPDIYNGYIAWASIVVDWMSGKGPDMYVISKDQLQSWSIDWAEKIATPWAEHMAYRMGKRDVGNKTGLAIMCLGVPISAVIGLWQQAFGKSNNPAGRIKGSLLIVAFTLLRGIVAVGDLFKGKIQ